MPEIEVKYQASLSLPLAQIKGEEEQSFLTQQLHHGDIYLNPSIFDTFASSEEHSAWIESYTFEEPEYHENDKQGWTYIADYTIHPNTPYLPADAPINFFIYAKIDHENKLRFGIFPTHPDKRDTTSSLALARIQDHKTAPYIHGDQHPALRIASKEEAEAKLLKNGKLIRSALPKLVGIWVNMGEAKIKLNKSGTRIKKSEDGEVLSTESIAGESFYGMKTYYGHIWSYWANIIDNTLYFVGVPISNDDRKGTIVYTKSAIRTSKDGVSTTEYVTRREDVDLPPTEDDFKLSFTNNWLIRQGGVFPSTHPLRVDVLNYFESSPYSNVAFRASDFRVADWLESHMDTDSASTWLTRPLAKIESNHISQLNHGDIASNTTLLGYEGGVFYDSEKSEFVLTKSSEVTYSRIEDENHILFSSHSSGQSGYVTARTVYDVLGRVIYTAQCFHASQIGSNYSISSIGADRPLGVFTEELLPESAIELAYHYTHINVVENEGTVVDWTWTGGGGEEDDPPSDGGGIFSYINGYVGGEGIIVKGRRTSQNGNRFIIWEFDLDHSVYVALAREIEFESKITASVRAMFSGKIANIDVGIASATATSLELEFAGTDGDDTSTKTELNTAPLIPDWSGRLELDLISIGSSAPALTGGKYVTVEASSAPANISYQVQNWYKVSLNKAALKAELESNLRQCYQRLSVYDTKTMSSNGETLTATSTGNPLDYTITVS